MAEPGGIFQQLLELEVWWNVGQGRVDTGHVAVRCHDLLLPVKDEGRGQVHRHHERHVGRGRRRLSKEEIKQPHDVLVIGQHVTEPGNEPGQGEDRSNLAFVQEVVKLRALAAELKQ